ncbi:hypothetical protein T484DRAFT_1953935 [Baffinella frigidus]|nr:hypothetical protein T484DRAFT_1953935 [Cryptophyta sp. CCMP2293]
MSRLFTPLTASLQHTPSPGQEGGEGCVAPRHGDLPGDLAPYGEERGRTLSRQHNRSCWQTSPHTRSSWAESPLACGPGGDASFSHTSRQRPSSQPAIRQRCSSPMILSRITLGSPSVPSPQSGASSE